MRADWQLLLDTVVARPAALPGDERHLRGALLPQDLCAPALDRALAAAWRAAKPIVRRRTLAEALEGLVVGPALCATLVDSVERDDHDSANAALHALHDAEASLTAGDWRRIAARAVAQRDQLLPDVEAATLLAEQGPEQALPTLVLLAFRPGPEDAEDRQCALASLGRFGDPSLLPVLAAVARTGALGIEVATASADFAARRLEADLAVPAAVDDVLAAVIGIGRGRGIDTVDGWQRWSGIDLLSRIRGEAALPAVAAAWLAGGRDLEPWYEPALEQRCRELLPAGMPAPSNATRLAAALSDRGLVLPPIAPIPPIRIRASARSPRISRRAIVLLAQSHMPAAEVETIKAERAAVEQALVQRRQLMGSFLTAPDTEAALLDERWRPTSELLPEAERAARLAAEARWLKG